MNSTLIVNIIILAVLIYIAFKLYIIARAVSQSHERFLRDREPRDVSSSGQTINVNVAPVPGSPQVAVTSREKNEETSSIPNERLPDSVGTSEDRPVAGGALSSAEAAGTPEKKSVQSGTFAIKCSRCKAENSSYRTECFNCGNPL